MDLNKEDKSALESEEVEKLYQLYIRFQSDDKTALDEIFKQKEVKQLCKVDEMNKEYRLSHMDNVLDSEVVLDNEKDRSKIEWIDSTYSKVTFQFSCLSKILYKKKKKFFSDAKNTRYENGKKKKDNGVSKFYEGKYDISDFDELMYETIIEIFNAKTDENNCLTLNGKKNKNPICDGKSLLENISYFTSLKINKRAKISCLDIFDTDYDNEESEIDFSYFDKYVVDEFLYSEGSTSRLMMYEEYLEWIKRNDIHKLFKANASNIKVIIETIMNCDNAFIIDVEEDIKVGPGMRFVSQKILQQIIRYRYGINIEQENISKAMKTMEQRLLDHLLYSLNYKIGKAEKSKGIYEKESERFLYNLDKKAYIKIFGRASYELYNESIRFVNSGDFNGYFKQLSKYEDMVIHIVSLQKGKKKYDMINLMISENNDLVDDKQTTILNIANTIIEYYQKLETEYQNNELSKYKIKDFLDWEKRCWEAELSNKDLKIQLFSSEKVKKPAQYNIKRQELIVYCGCMNYYFCDEEKELCYVFSKDRRVISRTNKNHEIFWYKIG